MSLHNFLPPNRENVGYKVFPLPKSIRLDDPNYIHYTPTEPIFGDRFESDRKDSASSYNAPPDDDRTILRTHVSVSSFRRSTGSLPPVSAQTSTPSPSKEKDVIQSFYTAPPTKEPEDFTRPTEESTPETLPQPPVGDAPSPEDVLPERHSRPATPEPQVIERQNSNPLEQTHNFNSVDDFKPDNASVDSRENDEKLESAEKPDHAYQDPQEELDTHQSKDHEVEYAVIPPRDQRTPPHPRTQQQDEDRATFGEVEYDVAVGPPPSNPVGANAIEVANETNATPTGYSTPRSTISEEALAPTPQAALKKNHSPPPAYFEELKQVTSSLGAVMQLKEEQKEAISKKQQEVETERQKAKSDCTAEKFLSEVATTDARGVELTEAQRLVLAQQLAEQRFAEKEAELLAEFEEWKRVRDLEIQWTVRRSSSQNSK